MTLLTASSLPAASPGPAATPPQGSKRAPSPPPWRKRLKRRGRFYLVRGVLALLAQLPLGLARRFGEWLGAVGYRFARRERQRALESLAQAFPERDEASRQALAQASFRHLGRAAMEVACIRKLDARLEDEVDWPPQSRAVLERALARGRGVIFVSAHLGHWELLARRVGKAGFPCQSIARETTDARLTQWVSEFRAAGGVQSIWRGADGAARQMLRALKAGEILGLLIDQDTDVQSVWVPFFGKPAKTPRAAADLALRTGAALLFGVCPREGEGRYVLHFEEVEFQPSGDRDADAWQLTAALTARIESAVRRFPEQWVWMHRRWKSPPPGVTSP